MQKIITLLARLPIGFHYWMADYVLYPLLYYIVRYRRKTVRKNLTNSFPEKDSKAIIQIEKGFYHHFSNVLVEIIYGFNLQENDMYERMCFDEEDVLRYVVEPAKQYGGVIAMMAHLGNWEWYTFSQKHTEKYGVNISCIYRKLKNDTMDRLMHDMRIHQGGRLVEKQRLLRQMIKDRQDNALNVYGLLADQKPRPESARCWTEFLHQETGWLDGGEVLSKKFHYPVIYLHLQRKARGYYTIRIIPITMQPETTAENEITMRYAKLLEENIREQPELWLWTHNRWKWARPKNKELQS